MTRGFTTLGALLLAACTGAGGPSGSVRPAEREILPEPSDTLVALPDGRLVVQVAESLAVMNPRSPEVEPMVVGLASEIGTVYAAVRDGDAVLVLAAGGSFVLRGGSWVPSPFSEGLDGPIRGATRLDTATGFGVGELWVLTDASLYRVIDGVAERFVVEGDLEGAQLAAVRRPEGPALWVLLPDRLLEVWRDRTGVVRSASLTLEALPTAIAGDAAGGGWLVIDGSLHALGPDRRLVDHGVRVDALVGDPRSSEVWALGERAWLGSGDALYEVEDVDVSPEAPRALAVDGSLFVSDGALVRWSPRRDVAIEGPADGSLLAGPTELTVVAEGEPTIEARLDGDDLEVAGAAVQIDPASLGDGTHTLEVTVRYDDGTLPTEERRVFEIVSNASWEEHVGPIYEAHCAACHGAEGPANTRLDDPERWSEENLAEQILVNVRDGRMPLGRPPLSQREVALIEAWMVNGFAP